MSALALTTMQARRQQLRLVIFDCEPIADRPVTAGPAALGRPLPPGWLTHVAEQLVNAMTREAVP